MRDSREQFPSELGDDIFAIRIRQPSPDGVQIPIEQLHDGVPHSGCVRGRH